ncbi:MAG: hypothetical protein ABW120_00385 [Sedimenticola sp.]
MNRSHKYALNPLAVACGIALLTTGQAHAGGYKIPEQSVNSTALSAAYVANAQGPDSSYYNPAAIRTDFLLFVNGLCKLIVSKEVDCQALFINP